MTGSNPINSKIAANTSNLLTPKDHDDKIKGAASAVSLSEIEDLFSTLEDQMNAKGKGNKNEKSGEEKLLALITELVNEIESGKAPSGKAMAALKGQVAAFYNGDPDALGKILSVVMPAVMSYTQKHPEDLMAVIKAFAPLMAETGADVVSQVENATVNLDQFKAGYEADNNPKKEAMLSGIFGSVFDGNKTATHELIMEVLDPEFIKALKADTRKGGKIASTVYTLITAITVKGGNKAADLAVSLVSSDGVANLSSKEGADLEEHLQALKTISQKVLDGTANVNEAVKATMKVVVNPTPRPVPPNCCASGPVNSKKKANKDPTMTQILAEAMMSAQMLQGMITNAQSKQDQWSLQLSVAKNKQAQASMIAMNKKIADAAAEEAKANKKPHWWDYLIKALVAIVAVVVAVVTAGVGAAIAAAVVGIFMATPLMGMTVKAIAKKVSGDVYNTYYKKYKAEGKSDDDAKQLAQEKADAVGQVIGQVVCIVAVVVLSFGIGGISAGAEDATNVAVDETANTVVDETADVGADAAEESEVANTSNAAKAGSKSGFSSSLARKVAAFQGLSTVAASNIWMSAMQTNPEWFNDPKNQKLIVGLDAALEIVTMIVAVLAGGSAMNDAAKGSTLAVKFASSFAKYGKTLLAANALMGAGEGGYSSYSSAKQAEYLNQAASDTQALGADEASFQAAEGFIKLFENIQKGNLQQTQSVIKSEGSMMDALSRVAGTDADSVNRTLQNAG